MVEDFTKDGWRRYKIKDNLIFYWKPNSPDAVLDMSTEDVARDMSLMTIIKNQVTKSENARAKRQKQLESEATGQPVEKRPYTKRKEEAK